MQTRLARYKSPGWATIALTAGVALAVSSAMAFSKPLELRIDGQPVISDVPPVRTAKNGVYVPLRALSDALGAETRYEAKSGEVTISHGDQVLHVKVGATRATINGATLTLKQPPFRVRGRIMVGLRAVQRVFGVVVSYDKNHSRIDMNSPGMPENSEPEAP